MVYNPKEFQCIGDDLSLLVYPPKNSYGETENYNLIMSFKKNDAVAVRWVTDVAIQLFTNNEKKFQNKLGFRYLVALPRSTALRPNLPCEHVCSALAHRFTWLTHLPYVLVRTQTVPKSAFARSYEERPKYALHMETIEYTGPNLHIPNDTIVMLDDIITCGEISRACRSILKRETACKRVMGLFVGRTV